MTALLRERPAHRDAKFVDLDESFVARKNCVLELESSSSKAASAEVALCFQITAPQIDLANVRADLSAARFSTT